MRIRPLAALSTVALATILLAGCTGGLLRRPVALERRRRRPLLRGRSGGRRGGCGHRERRGGAVRRRRVHRPPRGDQCRAHRRDRGRRCCHRRRRLRLLRRCGLRCRHRRDPSGGRIRRRRFPAEPITVGSGADSSSAAPPRARASSWPFLRRRRAARRSTYRRPRRHPGGGVVRPQDPGESFPTAEFSAEGAHGDDSCDGAAGRSAARCARRGRRRRRAARRQRHRRLHRHEVERRHRPSTRAGTRGEPATFATTGVVAGFKSALEGQTVGSTVVVAMPPVCGYGEAGSSQHELAGETLVFVVDILETARPE